MKLDTELTEYLIRYYSHLVPEELIHPLNYPYLNNQEINREKDRIAQILLKNYTGGIYLNYCPKCNRLARTPRASQCRYCGHRWYLKEMNSAVKLVQYKLSRFLLDIRSFYLKKFILNCLKIIHQIIGYSKNKIQIIAVNEAKNLAELLFQIFAKTFVPEEHGAGIDNDFVESKYGFCFIYNAPYITVEGKNSNYVFCMAIVDKITGTAFLMRPTLFRYRTLILYDKYRENLKKFFEKYEDHYIVSLSDPITFETYNKTQISFDTSLGIFVRKEKKSEK